ncbi:hypothetical protein ABZ638_34735 [Streptomyces sp. NPDC007107]|uniref:hypothetical protein n=1 Tax=Streptomyces sp. NPDC007107 TaxID=3156915 RepID=UPI0033DC9CE9
MTTGTRPPAASGPEAPAPGRLAAVTALCSVIATVVLALTGHAEVAAAAGVASGIQVTVHIHRRPPGQE